MTQSSRALVCKIERDVIARGIFTSVKVHTKLLRYIRSYNRAPKPIKWMFQDIPIDSPASSSLQATREQRQEPARARWKQKH